MLLTYVPPFPIYPPETAWMRTPRTDIPGLIVRTTPRGSRIVFLAADLDRRFGRDNLPDHGDLLARLVRWAAGDAIPLIGRGEGDSSTATCTSQPGRMILHLVNLTNGWTGHAPLDELIPVGPLKLRVKLNSDVPGRTARRLVDRGEVRIEPADWLGLASRSPTLLDHEVVVISLRRWGLAASATRALPDQTFQFPTRRRVHRARKGRRYVRAELGLVGDSDHRGRDRQPQGIANQIRGVDLMIGLIVIGPEHLPRRVPGRQAAVPSAHDLHGDDAHLLAVRGGQQLLPDTGDGG